MNLGNILSVIAIVVSIGTLIWQYFKEKSRDKVSMEATYYKEIYFDYMFKKIPEAREVIEHINNKISSVDAMIETINNMRKNSIFFRFQEREFYDKIFDQLTTIEDYFVQNKNREVDNDQFHRFLQESDELFTELYSLITNRYLGNSSS